MNTKKIFVLVSALALTATAALAGTGRSTSEDFGTATWRERTEGVTLMVSSYAASVRSGEFVPLQIAVAARDTGKTLEVTPESFILIDENGNRYAAASWNQIREYGQATYDASLMRAFPMPVGEQFGALQRVPSRFYPDVKGFGTVIRDVSLPPFTWFHDVLYFPYPEAGLNGVLTLQFQPKGLDHPVDVRFRVGEAGNRASR